MNPCRTRHSLRAALLRWMLLPLLLLWCLGLALAWPLAQWLASQPFDQALRQQARLLADTLAANKANMPDRLAQDMPPAAMPLAMPAMPPVNAPGISAAAGAGDIADDIAGNGAGRGAAHAGAGMDAGAGTGAKAQALASTRTAPAPRQRPPATASSGARANVAHANAGRHARPGSGRGPDVEGRHPNAAASAPASADAREGASQGAGTSANTSTQAGVKADINAGANTGATGAAHTGTNAAAPAFASQPAAPALAAIRYQVLDPQGRLLAGQRDLPPPPAAPARQAAQAQLRNVQVQGQPWRAAWLWAPAPGGHALVQAAQPLAQRNAQASRIFRAIVLPLLALLLLAAWLAWLALARGIRPLAQLEQRILARRPDDLGPLDTQAVPQELAPLVQSLNNLLTRLGSSIQTQKRFLADAAHQLKTPLAGLRMQAELARREDIGAQELKASLEHIGLASVRATHTVNQLLALARAEGSGALGRQPVDLAALTTSVVQEAVPAALERGIDLGYDGPAPGDARLLRQGNPVLLHEMLRNLIDNALFYAPGPPTANAASPAGSAHAIADMPPDADTGADAEADTGADADADADSRAPHTEVTVRLRLAPPGGGLFIEVEDNGPGVPQAERELIFQPFYRVLGTRVDGTGLGLPIVREIARQHAAEVSVTDTRPGHHPPGARFVVRFH